MSWVSRPSLGLERWADAITNSHIPHCSTHTHIHTDTESPIYTVLFAGLTDRDARVRVAALAAFRHIYFRGLQLPLTLHQTAKNSLKDDHAEVGLSFTFHESCLRLHALGRSVE